MNKILVLTFLLAYPSASFARIQGHEYLRDKDEERLEAISAEGRRLSAPFDPASLDGKTMSLTISDPQGNRHLTGQMKMTVNEPEHRRFDPHGDFCRGEGPECKVFHLIQYEFKLKSDAPRPRDYQASLVFENGKVSQLLLHSDGEERDRDFYELQGVSLPVAWKVLYENVFHLNHTGPGIRPGPVRAVMGVY